MALTRDAVFVDPQVQLHNGNLTLDLGDTTPGVFVGALWTGSVTPNFSQTSPAYGAAPWDAGESSGPGYSAGGQAIEVVSFAELVSTPGKSGWLINPLEWTETTLTAEGLLIYRASDDLALLLRYFGQQYTTADGVFSITPHTDGIWRRAHLGQVA
ncbi:hypothetical protein OG884_18870 [Streptosporangium sp. NBC_01755]|uniref:hypothetical protein n=1 Tax=unclassified Streptosporangium TaxID=2632669 RepID=UPI002DDB8550|nr:MULTISPECIES: hypothetical protein [unclassified Streptosporangium]WSA23671.1 hypothetical protein OIE13_22280 [Streptosporangium sp. NBC_01810]WSD01425.1 hypothetical protein OG884_05730 [Streptosporangium sp. NBC_01755]WSD03872.1 hypothetical protein OG884_18870 [Streptosporangium sp. NBC_01755]